MLTPGARLLDASARAWLEKNFGLAVALSLVLLAVCFLLVWRNACRRNCGLDSLLLMACVLVGLTVPSINHDYTLPMLTSPFALMVSERYTRSFSGKPLVIVLLILSSFLYAITLVPSLHKPLFLQNNFPLLVLLLIITTILSFLRKEDDDTARVRLKSAKNSL